MGIIAKKWKDILYLSIYIYGHFNSDGKSFVKKKGGILMQGDMLTLIRQFILVSPLFYSFINNFIQIDLIIGK